MSPHYFRQRPSHCAALVPVLETLIVKAAGLDASAVRKDATIRRLGGWRAACAPTGTNRGRGDRTQGPFHIRVTALGLHSARGLVAPESPLPCGYDQPGRHVVLRDAQPVQCRQRIRPDTRSRYPAPPAARPVRQLLRGPGADPGEIGRASCRERGCQYEEISVVAGSVNKKKQ